MKNCNCSFKNECTVVDGDEWNCNPKIGRLHTYNQRLIFSLVEILKEYHQTIECELGRSILDEDQYSCIDAIELIEEITKQDLKSKIKNEWSII